MRQLQKKLNSHRGATILLALLFLLLCMMVAATILMAAVSNAGKAQRSRTEQQKYLTLSSALGFVCDQLEKVEYRGRYICLHEDIKKPKSGAVKDTATGEYKEEDMEVVGTFHTFNFVKGGPGAFSANTLEALKPLDDELYLLFQVDANYIGKTDNPNDEYYAQQIGVRAEDGFVFPENTHTMTLKVDLTKDLQKTYPGLSDEVTVTAEVRPTGVIHLIATLGAPDAGGYQYTMEAEMNPVKKPREVLAKTKIDQDGITEPDGKEYFQTQPLTWKLGWVSKQEEVAEP